MVGVIHITTDTSQADAELAAWRERAQNQTSAVATQATNKMKNIRTTANELLHVANITMRLIGNMSEEVKKTTQYQVATTTISALETEMSIALTTKRIAAAWVSKDYISVVA